MFRTIIECSSMINNDEYIVYTKNLLTTDKDAKSNVTYKMFDDPHIVISRPVFDFEIKEGLIVENIDKFDEKPPKITLLLDTIYSYKNKYQALKGINPDLSIEDFLLKFVTYEYYDCMSGGMPHFSLLMVKYYFTVLNPDYDRNAYIYPSEKEKGFDSLQDFLDETKKSDISELAQILDNIQSKYNKNLLGNGIFALE